MRRAAPARRFRALVGYRLADLLRAQRVLVPAVVHIVLLAVLLAHDPRHDLPGPWPVSVLALYAASAWLALAAVNTEEPDQQAVTVSAAGRAGRVAAGTVVAILVIEVPLVVLSAGVPAVLTPAGFPVPAVVGVLAHLVAAVTGAAVGMACARPFVARVGWAAALATTIVAVTATQPWLPPVGTTVRVLSTAERLDAGVAVGLVVDLFVGTVVLAAVGAARP